jgi:hypothetical protein
MTDHPIAGGAEKTAHFAGLVFVIYIERAGLPFAADSAGSALCRQHFVIGRLINAVFAK